MSHEPKDLLEELSDAFLRSAPGRRWRPLGTARRLFYRFSEIRAHLQQTYHDASRFLFHLASGISNRPPIQSESFAASLPSSQRFAAALDQSRELPRDPDVRGAPLDELYDSLTDSLRKLARALAVFLSAELERLTDEGRAGLLSPLTDGIAQCRFYEDPAQQADAVDVFQTAAMGQEAELPADDQVTSERGTGPADRSFEVFLRRSLSLPRARRVCRRFPRLLRILQLIPPPLERCVRFVSGQQFDPDSGENEKVYLVTFGDRYVLAYVQASSLAAPGRRTGRGRPSPFGRRSFPFELPVFETLRSLYRPILFSLVLIVAATGVWLLFRSGASQFNTDIPAADAEAGGSPAIYGSERVRLELSPPPPLRYEEFRARYQDD